MPWPRLRMWPMPRVCWTASRALRAMISGGPRSTQGSTLPCSATRRPKRSRSAAKSWRQSTLRTLAPVVTSRSRRWPEFLAKRITGTSAAQFRDQELRRGPLEIAIGGEVQFAGPSVEQLHGCGARGDLRSQIDRRRARDLFEQAAEQARLAEQHGFRGGESVARVALNQVAGQRPGSGGEAQHRHVRAQRSAKLANGIAHEARFALRVEHAQALRPARRCGWGNRSPGRHRLAGSARPWLRRE